MKVVFEFSMKDYKDFDEFLDLLWNCDPFPKFKILKAPKKWLNDKDYECDEQEIKESANK